MNELDYIYNLAIKTGYTKKGALGLVYKHLKDTNAKTMKFLDNIKQSKKQFEEWKKERDL